MKKLFSFKRSVQADPSKLKLEQEYEELKQEYQKAVRELHITEHHFLNAETDKVEIAIYQLKAAETKVNLLIKDMKNIGNKLAM